MSLNEKASFPLGITNSGEKMTPENAPYYLENGRIILKEQKQESQESIDRDDSDPIQGKKKRPKKLKCRPGYTQRGSACQPNRLTRSNFEDDGQAQTLPLDDEARAYQKRMLADLNLTPGDRQYVGFDGKFPNGKSMPPQAARSIDRSMRLVYDRQEEDGVDWRNRRTWRERSILVDTKTGDTSKEVKGDETSVGSDWRWTKDGGEHATIHSHPGPASLSYQDMVRSKCGKPPRSCDYLKYDTEKKTNIAVDTFGNYYSGRVNDRTVDRFGYPGQHQLEDLSNHNSVAIIQTMLNSDDPRERAIAHAIASGDRSATGWFAYSHAKNLYLAEMGVIEYDYKLNRKFQKVERAYEPYFRRMKTLGRTHRRHLWGDRADSARRPRRPTKLKCRPGFEQIGAVCQPRRSPKLKQSSSNPLGSRDPGGSDKKYTFFHSTDRLRVPFNGFSPDKKRLPEVAAKSINTAMKLLFEHQEEIDRVRSEYPDTWRERLIMVSLRDGAQSDEVVGEAESVTPDMNWIYKRYDENLDNRFVLVHTHPTPASLSLGDFNSTFYSDADFCIAVDVFGNYYSGKVYDRGIKKAMAVEQEQTSTPPNSKDFKDFLQEEHDRGYERLHSALAKPEFMDVVTGFHEDTSKDALYFTTSHAINLYMHSAGLVKYDYKLNRAFKELAKQKIFKQYFDTAIEYGEQYKRDVDTILKARREYQKEYQKEMRRLRSQSDSMDNIMPIPPDREKIDTLIDVFSNPFSSPEFIKREERQIQSLPDSPAKQRALRQIQFVKQLQQERFTTDSFNQDARRPRRPDKLKCRPGFEQIGAVCQPRRPKQQQQRIFHAHAIPSPTRYEQYIKPKVQISPTDRKFQKFNGKLPDGTPLPPDIADSVNIAMRSVFDHQEADGVDWRNPKTWIERCILVDASDGSHSRLTASTTTGKSVSPDLKFAKPGRRYIAVHSHPFPSTLTPADMRRHYDRQKQAFSDLVAPDTILETNIAVDSHGNYYSGRFTDERAIAHTDPEYEKLWFAIGQQYAGIEFDQMEGKGASSKERAIAHGLKRDLESLDAFNFIVPHGINLYLKEAGAIEYDYKLALKFKQIEKVYAPFLDRMRERGASSRMDSNGTIRDRIESKLRRFQIMSDSNGLPLSEDREFLDTPLLVNASLEQIDAEYDQISQLPDSQEKASTLRYIQQVRNDTVRLQSGAVSRQDLIQELFKKLGIEP